MGQSMLPIESVVDATDTFQKAEGPVSILFCASSKDHDLKVLGHEFEKLVSPWSNGKLSLRVVKLFKMEQGFVEV